MRFYYHVFPALKYLCIKFREMKILHTADWHLGNTFHGHGRLLEHKHFLSWLQEVVKQEQPDALLVTGDIFDTANPSAAAEELLYDFLLNATVLVPGLQIVLTAGNHDSAGRLEAPAALLKTHNIYVRGTIHYLPSGEPDFNYYLLPLADRQTGQAACVCMALPYLRTSEYPAGMSPTEGLRFFFSEMQRAYRRSEFRNLPLIAAAHFYAAGAEVCQNDHSERVVVGGQDCVEADVVGREVSYVALGHIHKAQEVTSACHTAYAGSALPMSFAEINYQHGVTMIDLDEEGRTATRRIVYEPLRKLITIPANGNAVSATEVFKEIDHLPSQLKVKDVASYPYLEVRVEERQPEPTLMHDVMQALEDKAVRFCRMVRVRPETLLKKESDEALAAVDQLASQSPLDLAQTFFQRKYGNEMPQTLAEKFKRAMDNATQQTSK